MNGIQHFIIRLRWTFDTRPSTPNIKSVNLNRLHNGKRYISNVFITNLCKIINNILYTQHLAINFLQHIGCCIRDRLIYCFLCSFILLDCMTHWHMHWTRVTPLAPNIHSFHTWNTDSNDIFGQNAFDSRRRRSCCCCFCRRHHHIIYLNWMPFVLNFGLSVYFIIFGGK